MFIKILTKQYRGTKHFYASLVENKRVDCRRRNIIDHEGVRTKSWTQIIKGGCPCTQGKKESKRLNFG